MGLLSGNTALGQSTWVNTALGQSTWVNTALGPAMVSYPL